MSSYKQKILENDRYPHVKRGWIKAIKAIRNRGGIQKRIYLVEHPQRLDASQKRQRIAQDTGGYINHSDPGHWIGGGRIIGSPNPRYVIATSWLQTPSQFLPKGYLDSDTKRAKGTKCGEKQSGFHPAPLLTA